MSDCQFEGGKCLSSGQGISVARSHASAVRFEVGQAEDPGTFEDSSFDAVCLLEQEF